MDSTWQYYQNNAVSYQRKTLAIDMGPWQNRFMMLLPLQATLADIGCGSGRDLQVFAHAGYQTIGIDYCPNMIELSRQLVPAAKLVLGDLKQIPLADNSVDGIWCCASLLHIYEEHTLTALQEMARVGKPGAVMFLSVKKGQGHAYDDNGRLFVYFRAKQLAELLQALNISWLHIEESVDSNDVEWINVFARLPLVNGQQHTALSCRAALLWGKWLGAHLMHSSPELETEQILQHTLQIDKANLYCQPKQLLSLEQDQRFCYLLDKRRQHVPLAYLLKKQSFMGLDIFVTKDVLIPRPETELIVEYALEHLSYRNMYGLDLGTGSGCIAVALAKYLPNVHVVASDISAPALEVARKNVYNHGVQQRIDLVHGDLWKPFAAQCQFDFIVSNPPYVSHQDYRQLMPEVQHEPKLALLANYGIDFYRRILQEAHKYLQPGALLILELGYGQMSQVQCFIPPWLSIQKIVLDYANIERILVLRQTGDQTDE